MKTLMRTTATGSEYWDSKAKRTLFVPRGKKPTFEVKDNPESMIGGFDLTNGKDITVVNGKVTEDEHTLPVVDLDSMNVDELLAFAKEHNIDVPGTMKKEDTIRKHIAVENIEISSVHE